MNKKTGLGEDERKSQIRIRDLTERQKTEAQREAARDALAQQNEALSKLNRFSIELSMLSTEDNLEAFITKRLKEISGAVAAIFSEYNPENRTTTIQQIEMDPGLLGKVVGLLGKQAEKIRSTVSDEMYREMTTEIIWMRRTSHEASFGAVSRPMGAAIQAMLKVDRFIGVAYLIKGKLYGTSLLAMGKGQPDPLKLILENFSFLAALSLRRKRAEETLRESEWNLKEAQRLGRIGHWEFDPGTQQIHWSDMVFALYERDPKLGPPSAEEEAAYYSAEDAELLRNIARRTIETGEPYKVDVRMRLPGGRYADVVAIGTPVKDAHGRVVKLLGTIQDITERRQAEERLASHHTLLQAIINSPGDIIVFSLDTNYRYTAFNEKHRREMKTIWNVDIQIGMNMLDCMNIPELRVLAKRSMDRALRGESFLEEQYQHNLDIYYEFDWNPVMQGKGVIGVSVFTRDITGRKKSEEEIRNLAKFPAENPNPILRIARDGTLLYVNEAGLSLLPDENLQVGQAAPPMLREAAFQVMNSGSSQMLDLECRQRMYSFFLAPVVGAGYANFYGRDITEPKQAEEDLRQTKENFRRSLDDSLLGIRIVSANGETLYANRAILDLYGYADAEEFISTPIIKRYTPESFIEFQSRMKRRLNGEDSPSEYEINIISKTGEIRCLQVSRKETVWDGQKQFQAIYQDITQRKKAEADLKKTLMGLRKALSGIIQVLSAVSEIRDPYTAGHQKRVGDLAQAIARELGLAPDRVEGIRVAGVIHDIGKLSIPAEILSKPARLTWNEYELIKSHVQAGYDILSGIDFAWPLAEMILQHHERMDGSGYPQQLKGDAILLESRILAVSDVIEAMASHRPYRPALGIEAAIEEIEKNKSVLYDPDVVSACLTLFREKGFEIK